MTVRTWVGRFCVADGHVAEEGPWLGSLIRQRPDEEADELYILIEPASPASSEFTSQLVNVVSQLYHRDPLSLTGALMRSLRAAHDHLRDWNQKSLKEHQVGAGATCLALRGGDAYLAQAGPAVAWVRSADGAMRRIEPETQDFEHSLGVAEEFEPRLTRIQLNPGDLVLAASTALEHTVPESHIERILARGADDALPELYLLCRDIPEFALVLLACFEPEPERPPDFLTRAGDALGLSAPLDDTPPAALGVLVGVPAGDGPETAEASLAAGTMGDFALPPRPMHEQVAEIAASNAPPPATGVRLRGDSATPHYRRSTGAGAIPQLRLPKLAVFAVFALAIVGLLAYVYLPGSVQQSREDKFTALVAGAREANARAQATGDAGIKRQLLADARSKLTDAAKIHKDNTDVTGLQADVASALAVLDAIYEIKDFTTVANLPQLVTGSLSVTRSVIGGGDAYFLDAKGKRVIRVPLDGKTAPETVLQDGGFAGVIQTSRPVQIAWSEQTGSLTVIDDKRQAFGYFPGRGTLPLTVRGIDGIGTIDAITGGGGNLYVLDVKQSQVWRYLPGQSGYDSERTALLDTVDLRNATELAVGQDVYVLDAKTGIRRFVSKAEAPFPLAGIDTPMTSPASLAVLPGSNRLVVADRGNKRVIVASAEGTFLRQIVSPAFTDLRAVSVDEGNGIIYVLNGDTLLKAAFPP
jgi:type II secretory pathway pseudopilin PulG